jgi:hypothetical protein
MTELLAAEPSGSAVPEAGQLVRVRNRRWVTTGVERSLPQVDAVEVARRPEHLVTLVSVDDDGFGEELRVIWELELATAILDRSVLPVPDPERFDDPRRLEAFLDAVRWGAITSADSRALQAPFRSGIEIEDYQLDPVVRALSMPRVTCSWPTTWGSARPSRRAWSSRSCCCVTGPGRCWWSARRRCV